MARAAGCVLLCLLAASVTHAALPPPGGLPYGADPLLDQTPFALGSVAMNIVLLESSGLADASTENWTIDQIQNIRQQIDLSIAFWEGLTAGYHPNARLDLVANYVNGGNPVLVDVEPISRPSDQQNLWIGQAMAGLGHTQPDYMDRVRYFNHEQRLTLQTHWSFTLFVVNDANDADHRFANGMFAYAEKHGPFAVVTYNNDGWGIDRLHRVVAHEMGHIFGGLDEYYAAGQPTIFRSGYLGGLNGNSEMGPLGQRITPREGPHKLMLDNTLEPSSYSLVQFGLRDADGDGVPDILDVPPILTGGIAGSDPDLGLLNFSGLVKVAAYPNVGNPSENDVTINTIAALLYRLDGGPWTAFDPVDGAVGDYEEMLQLNFNGLGWGQHVLEIMGLDSVDNASNVLSFSFTSNVPEPGAAGLLVVFALLRRRPRA